jgi:uncharacterized protein with PQ loop repeat
MIQVLAYVGGTMLSFQLIPQIYKIIKHKNADNISLLFVCLNWIGLTCMGIYAFFNNDYSLFISISLSLINTTILFFIKVYYSNFLPWCACNHTLPVSLS